MELSFLLVMKLILTALVPSSTQQSHQKTRMTALVGEAMSLRCDLVLHGTRENKVQWSISNSKDLLSLQDYHVYDTGNIWFPSLSLSHSGNYTCNINGTNRKASHTFLVDVRGR